MSESVLCAFVAGLAQQGLTPGTIRTYLAAVRHAQIVRGFPEPREQSSLPRLWLLQNGVRRDRAESGRATPRPRLPITPPILRRMRAHLVTGSGSGPEQADGRMLWAASVACFFGFFRVGELTVPARTAFDPRVHLEWGDVTRDGGQPPAWVRIFLKRSKTDQFGRGVAVYVGTTGDELCPVTAILDYVTVRGMTPGPFFRFHDGAPLTKARFMTGVRAALAQAGIPCQQYSGHSFRIGAATAAAEAGVEDSTIQALGRWSSSAFLTYIRTSPTRLAQLSRTLTNGRRHQ